MENNKYNLGREYEFYATTPLRSEKQGKDCSCNKKEITHKRLNIRTTNHPGIALGVYLIGKGKRPDLYIYPQQTR